MRLNFKIGYLLVQNQQIQWQHSRDLLRRSKMSQSIDGGSALSEASDVPSQNFSVMTPSVARFSRATSTDYRNYHMSNPNPQTSSMRFYGPRDMGGANGTITPTESDMIRFGKRVAIGGKLNNDELLQDHLREMRQHLSEKRNQRNAQIEQDRKYLARVADRDAHEKDMKMRSSQVLKNEFLFFNDQKQLENKMKKDQEREEFEKTKNDYFPFVSGELLEQHRKGLSGQMRADLQNYLVSKTHSGSMVGNGRMSNTGNSPLTAEAGALMVGEGQLSQGSSRLTKASPSIVKALHDSCYLRPDQNPRVIQDNDPVKATTWKAAVNRHQTTVSQQKQFN